jgi:hypothetical protein
LHIPANLSVEGQREREAEGETAQDGVWAKGR